MVLRIDTQNAEEETPHPRFFYEKIYNKNI